VVAGGNDVKQFINLNNLMMGNWTRLSQMSPLPRRKRRVIDSAI